jgi:glycosyltransferase involved in cell wall biosynthesis
MPVAPSSHPFFSVIITTYNRKMLLKRALQSLIQQTETDWEAIIIDDGSTDNTESEIKPFLNDNRLQFIYQKNTGYSLAKNSGIFLSKGKYITFLDSDDEYLLNHLETRKQILTRHPEIDFLYGGLSVIGNEYVPDRFDNHKLIHLDDCVIGGTFFIKKELALSLNGFRDIEMGSDADFFERVGATNSIIQKTSIRTYIYHRENPDSLTNIMMEKIINP